MTHADLTPWKTRTKLLTRYAQEVEAIRAGGDPFPVALEVNPANFCDQGCHWCISENAHQEKSLLKLDDPGVMQFFADFRKLGGQAVGWSGGGEPTRHPALGQALGMVGSTGVQQGLITHGAFAADLLQPIAEHCAWVRVSVDTADRDAYARRRAVRPEVFDHMVANVRRLVELGVAVGLNMNVAAWNRNHIERLYELSVNLGVTYLQVRPTLTTPFPHPQSEPLLLQNDIPEILRQLNDIRRGNATAVDLVISHDKFRDFQENDGGRRYRGCQSHRLFVVLNWDGDLLVCMYHLGDKRFVLGNVYEQSLEAIWKSDRRKSVLQFCNRGLDHSLHGCQVCCKGHEINKVLLGNIDARPYATEDGSPESPFL